ncbi:MAG TPA: carboxylesterase family protein [Gammaproteobacteria bacterium]|nr:carboxylesterase family protein [Gammaproteobacteria bacterium]
MKITNAAGRAGLLAAAGLLLCGVANAQLREPIKLDAGSLGNSTESSPGIRAFKGIPFAAPPVGALRWREPQPVAKWDGVRDASKFGNVCIQPDGAGRGPKGLNIAVAPGSPPQSEDCLYLNVWTGARAATERRPVMVYFFGGAFTEGAGSIPLYDGDALAKKGAVVVTMNYRLGPFGFFAHPALTADSPHKASGNYGLADMVASLRWVKSNIAAFGGDPGNVTVFGQSAGAMAIGSLVTSPETKGLIHRAIGQSGSWMGLGPSAAFATRTRAEETGLKAATDAGVTTVEQLRAMSAADVTAKFRSAGMIVDGWIIPEDPSDVFASGRQNPVDVLVGSNRDDLSFGPPRPATPEQFRQAAAPRWGALADQFLSLYPHATNEEASKSQADSANDGAFWHMRLFADYQKKQGRQAWLFYFAQNPPAPAGQPAFPAAHASEIPYAFNNLGKPALFPDPSDPALSVASAPDRKVADQMSSYWVNFARSGNPNGAGLPTWQEHRIGDSDRAMILDADPSSERLPAKARLELYDKLYAQMRAAR